MSLVTKQGWNILQTTLMMIPDQHVLSASSHEHDHGPASQQDSMLPRCLDYTLTTQNVLLTLCRLLTETVLLC